MSAGPESARADAARPVHEQARRLCRDLGGPDIDLWTLPDAAVRRAEAIGRPLEEAVRDVVGAELVVRAVAGDDGARARLVRLWRADVLRWCRWNAGAGVDPQEAAQEVLLRTLDRLHRVTEPLGFRSWLYAVTWRVLREQERGPWLRRWVLGAPLDRWADAERSAEEGLVADERNRLVQSVLQQLPLEARTLLWHAYVEGRTRPQIAELTGLAEGTVNRRLTRARARFRTLALRRGLAVEDPEEAP